MNTVKIISIIAIIMLMAGCVESSAPIMTPIYTIHFKVDRGSFAETPITVSMKIKYYGMSENGNTILNTTYIPEIITKITLYSANNSIYKTESTKLSDVSTNDHSSYVSYTIPSHDQPEGIIWTKMEVNLTIDNKTVKSNVFDYETDNSKWWGRIDNFGIEG